MRLAVKQPDNPFSTLLGSHANAYQLVSSMARRGGQVNVVAGVEVPLREPGLIPQKKGANPEAALVFTV
jgi:hypothetical protein